MSYRTVEVELENGRVQPSGPESLPAKARALLTILAAEQPPDSERADGSLAERVADLVGIGRGQCTDLSTNKAHLEDFGR